MNRAVGDRLCGAHRVRAAAAAIRRSRAHDREDADDNSWQSRPRHARANQESRPVCPARQRAGCTLQRAIAASHGHLARDRCARDHAGYTQDSCTAVPPGCCTLGGPRDRQRKCRTCAATTAQHCHPHRDGSAQQDGSLQRPDHGQHFLLSRFLPAAPWCELGLRQVDTPPLRPSPGRTRRLWDTVQPALVRRRAFGPDRVALLLADSSMLVSGCAVMPARSHPHAPRTRSASAFSSPKFR